MEEFEKKLKEYESYRKTTMKLTRCDMDVEKIETTFMEYRQEALVEAVRNIFKKLKEQS